jgi:glycine/D-amino acid oxidase-like deaminating enzyme/nitrite reductase/ring-hydroxylating ferredoxin subunit
MSSDLDLQTTSAWLTVPIPGRPGLTSSLQTDVCIVGAGIAGLTAAYLLAREGRSVVVLEARQIGSGETSRTTAHLSNAIDDRYTEIEKIHGIDGSRLAAASHAAAIDRIERICRDESLDCDFKRLDGWLLLAPDHSPDLLQEELAAAQRAGVAVSFSDHPPVGDLPALRFSDQARFHPRKYLRGLAAAAERLGVVIKEATRAVRIEDGEPVVVTAENGHTVTAANVLVATNSPINDRVVSHLKQSAYRTFAIGLDVPSGSVPDALFWDTLDPYHYVRLQPGQSSAEPDLLIVGGEDHRTGQSDDGHARFARLERWARARFPIAGESRFQWSGQIQETIDGLALAGRVPMQDHTFMISGDSGMGMTHATLGAMIITDLILIRNNSWESLYDPGRMRSGSLRTFVSDSANMAVQYADWIGPADAHSLADIPADEGMVVRNGLHRYAVYRAPDGTIHRCSAVCPHLGGLVRWNSTEKSWDCPVHGSRFTPTGDAIAGPASSGLSRQLE